MKIIFTLAILFFMSHSFCQITYTYIEPDPAIEMEKKDKEAYFQNLISDIGNKLRNCEKQCGSYAADANNPKDPCIVPGATPKCICDCRAFYNPSIARIEQQEKAWRADIFKREEDYKKRKLNEQKSEANKKANQPPLTNVLSGTQEQPTDPIREMQLKQQQTQQELDNAKTVSMNAYQDAINSGKKESGAILDATIAGAQQISDPTASIVYTGVGLGVSLFTHLSEIKAGRVEAEQAVYRKKMIIETKGAFLKELINISKYTISDLVSKERYAVLLIVPRNIQSEEELIYFTLPTKVIPFSDNTYPSKETIAAKLLKNVKSERKVNKDFFIIYPIMNISQFNDDFIKKIASGKVVLFNAQLEPLNKELYISDNSVETDFWGNPLKKMPNKTQEKEPIKKQNNFWNQ